MKFLLIFIKTVLKICIFYKLAKGIPIQNSFRHFPVRHISVKFKILDTNFSFIKLKILVRQFSVDVFQLYKL